MACPVGVILLCVYTQRGEVRGIISLYEPEGNGMPMARRTRADVDSLKRDTARDKLCKDAAEALIPEIRYQMFLICSMADGWADNDGRFGERSQDCPS